jgi:hypothetical protein
VRGSLLQKSWKPLLRMVSPEPGDTGKPNKALLLESATEQVTRYIIGQVLVIGRGHHMYDTVLVVSQNLILTETNVNLCIADGGAGMNMHAEVGRMVAVDTDKYPHCNA